MIVISTSRVVHLRAGKRDSDITCPRGTDETD
jgi:hypothetical protein